MTNQTQLSTIQFYNHTLATFEQNNVQYVAMRPICENIGLSWNAQFERIKRDEVLSSVIFIMKTAGNDGKEYQMLCLPIEYLNGWLFGIDVKRVAIWILARKSLRLSNQSLKKFWGCSRLARMLYYKNEDNPL